MQKSVQKTKIHIDARGKMKRIELDCDFVSLASKVKAMRKIGQWESRSNEFPFYTLGKSLIWMETLRFIINNLSI